MRPGGARGRRHDAASAVTGRGDPAGPEAPGAGHAARERTDRADRIVVPVVEERARIEARAVETGRVRVATRTETHEQVLRESLRTGHVGVARVPVDRTLDAGEPAPAVREEGGVTIIPVLEEILVVEKRLVLKEEVHVRRTTADEDVEVPVTLRRQRAVVERLPPDGHGAEPIEPPPEET